jgi:hypothetical protein
MWTCPKCHAAVDDQFEVCWQCGTNQQGVEDPTFVKADDAGPIVDPLYDPIAQPDPALGVPPGPPEGLEGELVEAYQALSLMEAKFLADQLTAAGIPALSDTQDMQDALGTWEGNPRVWVRAVDYPRARVWLEGYEMRRKQEHGPREEGE